MCSRQSTKLTLGEDIADLGGLILAYRAWAPKHANDPVRDGLTPPPRFFVGYAQWACANVRPETARLRARTDPHSPPRHRINGVVVTCLSALARSPAKRASR